ncbi:MAG: hypothetical protein ACYS7Y_04055 [Planctomycetota bacterium]|jgi:hypothetical protein
MMKNILAAVLLMLCFAGCTEPPPKPNVAYSVQVISPDGVIHVEYTVHSRTGQPTVHCAHGGQTYLYNDQYSRITAPRGWLLKVEVAE